MSLGPIDAPTFAYATLDDGTKQLVEVHDRNLYVSAADYTRRGNAIDRLLDELKIVRDAQGKVNQEDIDRLADVAAHEQYLSNLVTQIRRATPVFEEGTADIMNAAPIRALLSKPWPFAPQHQLDDEDFAKEMAKTPEQLARDYRNVHA